MNRDTFDYRKFIDSIYPAGRKVSGILLVHSRAVADEALAIAHRLNLDLDDFDIEAAAMLHDVGIIRTNAPGIGCYGSAPYLCHGPLGADMLRAARAPENTHAWLNAIRERVLPVKKSMHGIFRCLRAAAICPRHCLRNWCATPTASTAKAAPCSASRLSVSRHPWPHSAKMCWCVSADFTACSIPEPGASEAELLAAVQYYSGVGQ